MFPTAFSAKGIIDLSVLLASGTSFMQVQKDELIFSEG
jgi:hypothetical protein